MQRWKTLLGALGPVETFDYLYMVERRRRPDPLSELIRSHRTALGLAKERHPGPIFLVGKSMGGRIGCHVALEEPVAGLICLGYPLCGGGDRAKLRDKVLLALSTPVLFVQGTRDRLCPLDVLERVRTQMITSSFLHVVESGDHSLQATKTQLKRSEETQESVDARIVAAVASFCDERKAAPLDPKVSGRPG